MGSDYSVSLAISPSPRTSSASWRRERFPVFLSTSLVKTYRFSDLLCFGFRLIIHILKDLLGLRCPLWDLWLLLSNWLLLSGDHRGLLSCDIIIIKEDRWRVRNKHSSLLLLNLQSTLRWWSTFSYILSLRNILILDTIWYTFNFRLICLALMLTFLLNSLVVKIQQQGRASALRFIGLIHICNCWVGWVNIYNYLAWFGGQQT